jgi:hypothetical protein
MSNFNQYLENALLGATLLGSPFTALGTVFLSLATSINSDGDSFTEVTTNIGYGRIALATGVEWSDVTSLPDATVVNSATITFSPATSAWGVLAHFALYDNGTIGSGNQLYWGDLAATRDIQNTDVFEVQSGNLTVRLD